MRLVQEVVALVVDNALETVFVNADDGELALDRSAEAYGVVLNTQELGVLLGACHEFYVAWDPFFGPNDAHPKECKCQ